MRLRPHRPGLLWAHWDEISQRLCEARSWAIFLDYDGTISPAVPRPEVAVMTRKVQSVVGRLSRHPRVRIAVISGRRREDIEQRIGVRGIRYLGLYGWETEKQMRIPAATRKALHRAREMVGERLAGDRRLWIEDKNVNFTVHFRGARLAERRKALRIVRQVVRCVRPGLRIFQNARSAEVLPGNWGGKGTAVAREMRQKALHKSLPIYFGDDLTDEPAFAALRNGITVRVGDGRVTLARYRLRSPIEVEKALERMETLLP